MKYDGRTVLLCSCERTMELDGAKLCKALGADDDGPLHDHLCRTQVDRFGAALNGTEPLLIACTQEAPLFRELAEDAGKDPGLNFVNIRERAGWTQAKGDLTPKIAALLAETTVDVSPAGQTVLTSDGVCLVYGRGQAAYDVAHKLSGRLSVTLLLTDADDLLPPSTVDMAIYQGNGHRCVRTLSVRSRSWSTTMRPWFRHRRTAMQFMMARDGATSQCSLIFDMSGGEPLLPSHERRDGYFHVDPGHAIGVADAMFEISDLVGEFEKPLYVTYDPEICAHSRSQLTGCNRCLDVCPASAITHPTAITWPLTRRLCGGCGSCSAVCPSGAVSYAYPGREDLIRRVQVLLSTYLARRRRPHQSCMIHDNARTART